MPELTPEQKKKLQDELVKYAKEGASDDDLRTFKNTLVSQFESANTSIKKKGSSVASVEAGAGFGGGIPETSPSTSPLKSTSGLGMFQKGKEEALKELNLTAQELKKPVEVKPNVELTYSGVNYKIPENRVPDGYTKDIDGARNYAIDTYRILNDPSTEDPVKTQKIKELVKISNLTRLDENKKIISPSDLSAINKLIGKNYAAPSLEMVEDLNAHRAELKAKVSQERGVAPGLDYKYDQLLKKVANSLQQEVQGSGEVKTLGADTRSDLQSAFSDVEGNIKNIVGRMGKENMSNAFATGLESLQYTDKPQYEILKRRIAEGKTIGSAKVAEITNIGGQIIDTRNLEKLNTGEVDIDQYYAKKDELNKHLNENFYNRPDIVQKAVSEVIAKHYEKDGTALFGKWFVSDNEIDKVPLSEFEEAGIDMNRPEVKAAINSIKKNEGVLPFDNSIQKDALTRELGRGFMQPLKGTAEFIGNIGASDDERRLQRELEPVSNYVQKRGEHFNKKYGGIADAFNGLGQFASQYILMEGVMGGLKGIGKLAGGSEASTLVISPESATPIAIRQGTSIGNAIIDKSQLIGRLAVPYLQSYDSYYKNALEKTDNPIAAKVSAFVNASMESLSEQMFDNVKFGRQVVNNFRKGFDLNMVAKIFDKAAFDETAKQELKQTIKEGLRNSIDAVAKGTKGLVKESFEEVPVQFTNFVSDAILDPQSVDNRRLLPELKDAFMAALVSFSIPSIIGTAGRMKKIFTDKTTQQDALMIAARNRGDVVDAIYNQLEDGSIDQEEANTKLQVLNTAAATLTEMPKQKADGSPMSESNKAEYLALSVQSKILSEQNANIKDEAVKIVNEEKIKEINDKKLEILKVSPVVAEAVAPAAEVKPLEEVLTDKEQAAADAIKGKEFVALKPYTDIVNDEKSTVQEKREALKAISDQLLATTGSERAGEELGQKASIAIEELGHEAPAESEALKKALEPPVPDISVSEMIDKPILYNGNRGRLYQDGQSVIFKVEDQNKEYELGNIDEIKDSPIADFGLSNEQSVVTANDNGNIIVRDQEYTNNYSDPFAAINTDEAGNVVSVNLETADGKKRTFRGNIAEDVAYQIHLKEITKDNETTASFEQHLNTDPDAQKEMDNGIIPEVAPENTTQSNEPVQREKIEPVVKPIVNEQETKPEGSGKNKQSQQQTKKESKPDKPATKKTEAAKEEPVKEDDDNAPLSAKEAAKLSDQLFAFADKILKGDITGSGGGATMANIARIPQEILGRAVQVVALAVKAGETLASAINKGMEELKKYKVDKNEFRQFIKDLQSGNAEGRFNFFKNRELKTSGELLTYLSKDTLEVSGKEITQPFQYDKKTLDDMLQSGQKWMTDAKQQFNKTPVEYAVRLLNDLKSMKGRIDIRAVAMVSLLNSIDTDLKHKDLSYGHRDVLKYTRRELEKEIAENARQGSLTLNAQRLIHKLYTGEYNFGEAVEGIVTKPVQTKAENIVNKANEKKSTSISKAARNYHRNKKPAAKTASVTKKMKKAGRKGFFEKVVSKMSPQHIEKLKQQVIELANKIPCGKKK